MAAAQTKTRVSKISKRFLLLLNLVNDEIISDTDGVQIYTDRPHIRAKLVVENSFVPFTLFHMRSFIIHFDAFSTIYTLKMLV